MSRIIDGNKNNLIGKKVKYYRKKLGMSQRELSEKLETLAIYVCRGSLSRIEDGTRTVSDIELYGLATVLGVSLQALYPDDMNMPS